MLLGAETSPRSGKSRSPQNVLGGFESETLFFKIREPEKRIRKIQLDILEVVLRPLDPQGGGSLINDRDLLSPRRGYMEPLKSPVQVHLRSIETISKYVPELLLDVLEMLLSIASPGHGPRESLGLLCFQRIPGKPPDATPGCLLSLSLSLAVFCFVACVSLALSAYTDNATLSFSASN